VRLGLCLGEFTTPNTPKVRCQIRYVGDIVARKKAHGGQVKAVVAAGYVSSFTRSGDIIPVAGSGAATWLGTVSLSR
jgi:hypothetical protein